MSDERHASVDFEIVPDLVCGRSYRNPESEALAVAMRAGEVTPYTGCGKPLRWVYAYRCRQCGRWLHGPCMDRHFGGVDLTAELAAAQAREQACMERIKDALDCLPRALDGSRPFSLDQRAEVMLAIEALRAALAAAPEARDGE